MTQPGPGFSKEQQEYLARVIMGLNLHRAFAPAASAVAEAPVETVYGTEIEDLCKEEVAKHREHPLDIWERLERWTKEDVMAEGLDQFLLRHLGFFNVEPASQGYMMRLRAPACVLRADQMDVLARCAEDFGGGYAHVTTRGSIQIREIRPRSVIDFIEALESCGLTAQGTGADSARNLTVTPSAGFDPDEIVDMTECAKRLSTRIMRTRELQGIPRKFNISFDNAGRLSCLSDTNDIAFQAVNICDGADLQHGLWCRIALGGITGHKDFARDTGLLCRPDETVDVAEAMLRVFVEHGDRTNRKKARLKYLLEKEGVEWFVARSQEKLDPKGIALHRVDRCHDEPRTAIDRQAHIGIHPQKQMTLSYVGAALELGRLSPEQMRVLARVAREYGEGDIRLTVWQNPIIPWIPNEHVRNAAAELEAAGMPTRASAFAAGVVACTGKWACKMAAAYTKEDALALTRHLEERYTLDQPINIHLTGCANSCAQHYVGDIGLVGAAAPGGGEGYNIVVGGGSDLDQGLARPLVGPVAAADILPIVDHVIATYLAQRSGNQNFLEFVRGLADADLPTLLPHARQAAA